MSSFGIRQPIPCQVHQCFCRHQQKYRQLFLHFASALSILGEAQARRQRWARKEHQLCHTARSCHSTTCSAELSKASGHEPGRPWSTTRLCPMAPRRLSRQLSWSVGRYLLQTTQHSWDRELADKPTLPITSQKMLKSPSQLQRILS